MYKGTLSKDLKIKGVLKKKPHPGIWLQKGEGLEPSLQDEIIKISWLKWFAWFPSVLAPYFIRQHKDKQYLMILN